jgi:hypothetical protein
MSESNGVDIFVINTLEPKQEKLKIAGKDFVLKEMTEDDYCKYQNKSSEGIVFNDGKVTAIKNAADTNPYLIHLCLYEVMEDGKLKRLDVTVIRKWSKTATEKLVERCRKLNDLDNEEETEESLLKVITEAEEKLTKLREKGSNAKNLPGATSVSYE